MSEIPKAAVFWSSGKDSALALQRVRALRTCNVVALITTVSEHSERVAVHEVREALLEAQVKSLGLPLHRVKLPASCPNATYEARIAKALVPLKQQGVTHLVFGDLFLYDIRCFRESLFAREGMKLFFPLWLESTRGLANEIIRSGIRAVLTAVDLAKLPPSFAGRFFDENLLRDLPAEVDPCGENGEFHTFVFDGPMMSSPLSIRLGEATTRDGFAYADVIAKL